MRVEPLWWNWCLYKKRKEEETREHFSLSSSLSLSFCLCVCVCVCVCHVRIHSKKTAAYKARRGLSPETESIGTLVLDLPASRSVRNKSVKFEPFSLWCFAIAARTDYNSQWRSIRKRRKKNCFDQNEYKHLMAEKRDFEGSFAKFTSSSTRSTRVPTPVSAERGLLRPHSP